MKKIVLTFSLVIFSILNAFCWSDDGTDAFSTQIRNQNNTNTLLIILGVLLFILILVLIFRNSTEHIKREKEIEDKKETPIIVNECELGILHIVTPFKNVFKTSDNYEFNSLFPAMYHQKQLI